MLPQNGDIFEFENFRLDRTQKLLLRDGEPVQITPKVYDTLELLLRNRGRLLEKDELMRMLWPDRFVEDGNLTSNIKMLRKALGDDAAKPRFIETVPRRGYRFVAEVNGEAANGNVSTVSQAAPPSKSKTLLLFISLGLLFLAVLGGGWWYANSRRAGFPAPILAAPFRSESLSTNSRVLNAAISPDGKNVAYTNGIGAEKQTVWLKQLDSSTNVQIVPPSDQVYYNLAFAPDGNSLYFVRGPRPGNPAEQYAIYRIPTFGGIATRIVDEVQGWMSVSPDGSKLSFVRCYYREEELCSLWIADSADGRNERKLVSRPSPFRIGDNKFSPDGSTIAFAAGQSRNSSNEFSLAEVDIATGRESELTGQKFFDIKQLAWLPDNGEMLFTALQFPDKHSRIWRFSRAKGTTEALTKDSEDYWGLSLDRDAKTIVATQRQSDFRLNLYSTNDLKPRQLLADAATVAFAADGNLIVSAGLPGNLELWNVNAEGGGERQLTNDPADDVGGMTSRDGAVIFFSSNRSGETQVWQMRPDGTDQKQTTAIEGGVPLCVSPDGQTLYYHSALGRALRKVSVNDGREEAVVDKNKPVFAVSPDCLQAAFMDEVDGKAALVIVSTADGRAVRTFPIGDGKPQIVGMAFSSDGKTLFYISAMNDYEGGSLWAQPLDTASSKKIGDLPGDGLRNNNSFAISPDGKAFAIVQGTWKRDAILIKGLK